MAFEEIITPATGIKELNAAATIYSATVDGVQWSGIQLGSRFWKNVQKAIAEGAAVEKYKAPVVSDLDKLTQTDAKLVNVAARALEDILEERIADGKFVAPAVKDLITERKALRAKL
jgi:hypothetical protein